MTNALVDSINQSREKESNDELIGLVEIRTGYKSYAKGHSRADLFFPCDFSVSVQVNAARIQAQALSAKINPVFQMIVFRGTLKGHRVTWKGDKYFTYTTQSNAWTKVIAPALIKCGIEKLGKYWAHIAFAPNPSQRAKTKIRKPIAYILEVYPDESSAEAAAGGSIANAPMNEPVREDVHTESVRTDSTEAYVPEAWKNDPAGWLAWTTQVKESLKEHPFPVKRAAIEKLAKEQDIGASVDEVLKAIQ